MVIPHYRICYGPATEQCDLRLLLGSLPRHPFARPITAKMDQFVLLLAVEALDRIAQPSFRVLLRLGR